MEGFWAGPGGNEKRISLQRCGRCLCYSLHAKTITKQLPLTPPLFERPFSDPRPIRPNVRPLSTHSWVHSFPLNLTAQAPAMAMDRRLAAL